MEEEEEEEGGGGCWCCCCWWNIRKTKLKFSLGSESSSEFSSLSVQQRGGDWNRLASPRSPAAVEILHRNRELWTMERADKRKGSPNSWAFRHDWRPWAQTMLPFARAWDRIGIKLSPFLIHFSRIFKSNLFRFFLLQLQFNYDPTFNKLLDEIKVLHAQQRKIWCCLSDLQIKRADDLGRLK